MKGGKLRVIVDLAATDLPDTISANPHTPTQHKDLSVDTPMKLSVVDAAPSLTFKNLDSGAALGTEFDVQDWSVADYGNKATFTSVAVLGEAGPKIRFYWETTLNWTFKVKDKAGNWVNALGGAATWDTIHRSLCIANDHPIAPPYPAGYSGTGANQAWEKVMQYSCDWAKTQGGDGAAAKNAIVGALWAGIDVADTSGTGARHDINYTFINGLSGPDMWTVQAFCAGGCQGTCGHHSPFFSSIGAAQGIAVDVVALHMAPTADGYAGEVAIGVADVDGDWCEFGVSPLQDPPLSGANRRWWYNRPMGGPPWTGEHYANTYDTGGTIVYDPSFGVTFAGSWTDYLKSAVSHWAIYTGPGTHEWRTWNEVINNCNTIRFVAEKNYAAPVLHEWGVHHFKVQATSPQTVGATFNVTVTAEDVGNNTVTDFGGTVTLTQLGGTAGDDGPPKVGVHINNTAGAGDDNHTYTPAENGVHTFPVTAYTAETITKFTATAGGKSGDSSPVQVDP